MDRPPILHQNFVRPETSEARSRKTKDITSAQEKFIQITAELERKGLLTEHSASVIKSLILEENGDVVNVMNEFCEGSLNQRSLSSKLVKLAERLSQNILRPTSPLPKKDELIKLVNTLVRRRLRDDNDLLLLNKLILEGDELVYSTFEVFESDRDEEDLLDTLIRIVHKYKKMGKFEGSRTTQGMFHAIQKIPLVDSDHEYNTEKKESKKEERPSSGSYFRNRSRSKKDSEKPVEKPVEKPSETKAAPQQTSSPKKEQPQSQPVAQAQEIDKNQLVLSKREEYLLFRLKD